MALSDVAVRRAKANSKPYKVSDERGLYLLVNQAGKYWRYDYRFGQKRKTMALGVYDDVGLHEAREKRDDARKLLAKGIDPSLQRKLFKHAAVERSGDSLRSYCAGMVRQMLTKLGSQPRRPDSASARARHFSLDRRDANSRRHGKGTADDVAPH